MAYVALPAFRAPSAIDFTPLGEAFDTVGATLERNRLLREQRELGASLQQAQQAETGGNLHQAQPTNRLLSPAQYQAGGVVDRIIGAESGGRANATNPRSSATGAGQFISSTWLDTVKRARPDLAAGKSDQELLALRNNPNLSREMTSAYASENGKALQGAGFEATSGNTYLAHFAGPAGARSVLSSNPNASVRQVLGDRVAQANPFLANMTTGQLRQWADRRMGGASAAAETPRPAPPAGLNYSAGIQTALRQGNVAQAMQLQNAQQEAENTTYTRQRQGVQDQQAAETHELSTQSARETLQDKFINRVAGVAQTIGREADPAKKAQMWQRFVSTDPRIAAGIQKYGVDVNDPDAGVRAIIAEAQGLTGKKYEFTKYGVGDPSTGEIRPYAAGSGDPETTIERAKMEQSLRKEWSALTGDIKTINDSVARVKTGEKLDSGTGDLAIVYGYMKLLDPGSVVREGEFATAEQTAGLPQQIVGLYNKLIQGERLTPTQRKQFSDAANGLAGDKQKRFATTRKQFETIARQAGADPARIMLDDGQEVAAPATTGAPRSRAVNPQTNEVLEYNEQSGQWEPVR